MILPESATAIGDEGTYRFKVYVQEDLKASFVYTITRGTRDHPEIVLKEPIQGQKGTPIRFGQFHEKQFIAGRVYMRALYEKAVAAHCAYPEFPDPRTQQVRLKFECLCVTFSNYFGPRFP
mmetsp:Transcript_46565/g.110750  ORF Transcript_46565/g.110750 Transcript_46565/m.110750 type:complete len:121 (+) Transcript_46565:695-1057(+)